jgi:hypothetical protein
MRSPLLLAYLPLAVLACTSGKPSDGASTASAPASAPPVASSAAPAVPAAPPPDDLDVGELQKALKCAADAKSGPCALLAKIADCKPWGASVPSGDGRWLGRAFVVDAGKATDGFAVLRLKQVPLVDVGPGQLPVKIGFAQLTKDDGAAFDQADRAIRSYERGDVPQKSNAALEHLKQRATWPDAYAVRTVKGNVYGIAQGGLFACQGPRQQLIVVQRAATRGSGGDGLYAELWATSW